jgi:hypothetical protein
MPSEDMLEANPELARQFAGRKEDKAAVKKANAERTAERAKQTSDREDAKAAKSAKNKAAVQQQMMPQQMMPHK